MVKQNLPLLAILDRPIAFHRCLQRIAGSTNAALMLSQAIYWTSRTQNLERWFWKTRDEWQAETGLTRREQETARCKLRAQGLVQEERRGVPPTLYFRVDTSRLKALLTKQLPEKSACLKGDKSAHSNGTKPPIQMARNRPYITETTPETTSEEPPPTPRGMVGDNHYSQDFQKFWQAYPRQVGKPKAWRAWQRRVRPGELVVILTALESMRPSLVWTRESGRFIPYPATFLYERRWEDRNI